MFSDLALSRSSRYRWAGTAQPWSGSKSWRLTPLSMMRTPFTRSCSSTISMLRMPVRVLFTCPGMRAATS